MKKIFQMKEQSQKEAGVKDGKELHIRKNDWILIVILLVAAVGAYVAMQYYQNVSTKNAVAVVTAVSYTHLDVYKRQVSMLIAAKMHTISVAVCIPFFLYCLLPFIGTDIFIYINSDKRQILIYLLKKPDFLYQKAE